MTRPGLSAGVVAAFNVNKSAPRVAGPLYASDAEGPPPGGDLSSPLPKVAVYQRGGGSVTLLDPTSPPIAVALLGNGFDLFTFVPVEGGVAVFGLLDKYLGAAAVVSVKRGGAETFVRLREAGTFGAWTAVPPARVEIDGRALRPSQYSYDAGLLRVPAESFVGGAGEREVRMVLPPGAR